MDVHLEAFEGPLDLLLKLIHKNEVDIYDIPISQITAEYMEVVSTLPPDMENLSEFLVMAATLLEIKSRLLLPSRKDEGGEEEDPRDALARQLLAYKQAQELAAQLSDMTPLGARVKGKGDKEAFIQLSLEDTEPPEMVPLTQLEEILADLMRRAAAKIDTVRAGYGEMPKDKFTVTEKVAYIKRTLQEKGRLSLLALFQKCVSRREMVVTFLAILEMIRRGIISATQNKSFSDVEVVKCPA
ncbi:MAG: segregation/condensation protein A [Defluviitaleaceae bacterium]|nr:segregation/condensation protein A [Defluviitaleaceae bacterium]